MADPRKMVTPKNYWKTKRTENHAYWPFGYFRELFQNSTDAGAKNVHITLSDSPGKGAFGRDAKLDNVIRVIFSDDGTGMTQDILDKVYFSPGETSKIDGTTTGGFGTARIMTCFSQVRYNGRTGDIFFEGDGSEYEIMSTQDAIGYYRDLVNTTEDPKKKEELQAILAGIQADSKTRKGCRFEIDIDPTETISYGKPITLQLIKDALDDYLLASNLPCRVFVNGEENTKKTTKGAVKRNLSAETRDGQTVEFATVHTSMGEKAKHKGKVIVRVNGATMFIMPITSQNQVIVELKPELSRVVMTDNRDSLKYPFSYALTSFIEELSTDVRSAMQNKEEKRHTVIEGGLGEQVVYPKPDKTTEAPKMDFNIENLEVLENTNQPIVANIADIRDIYLQDFIEKVQNREPIAFLDTYHNQDHIYLMVENIRTNGKLGLQEISEELSSFIASHINRVALAGGAKPEDIRYSMMHNVHIYRQDDFKDDKKILEGIRRMTPNYWRVKGEANEGRGKKAHELLETWNIMCRYVMNAMAETYPNIAKNGLRFGTGWVFAKPQEAWVNNKYQNVQLEAQHRTQGNTHLLLLNPLLEDGSMAYNLSEEEDITKLMALAIHEGSHILGDRHDEDFAGTITKLASQFINLKLQKELRSDIASGLNGVRAAYGSGKSRVQTLDTKEIEEMQEKLAIRDEEEIEKPKEKIRPAQVLMSQAMPITTVVAGIATAPENRGKANEIELAVSSVFQDIGDGVMEIDNDRMKRLEKNMTSTVEKSIIHDTRQIDIEEAIAIVKENDVVEIPEPIVEKEVIEVNILADYDGIFNSLMQEPAKPVVRQTDKTPKVIEPKSSKAEDKPRRPRVEAVPNFSQFSVKDDATEVHVTPLSSLDGYEDILENLAGFIKPENPVVTLAPTETTSLLGDELDIDFDAEEIKPTF